MSFASQYEFYDFSEFKGISVILRGVDSADNYIVFGSISTSYDTPSVPFDIVLEKKTMQLIRIKTIYDKCCIDTFEIQQLAQKFLAFDIRRLDVDLNNNVFVFFDEPETLTMVKFINDEELLERSSEMQWKKIKGKWYSPKW